MTKSITTLPGDGVGPEVTAEAVKVLKAVAQRFDYTFTFQEALIGACAIDATGDPLPKESVDACASADAILLGAVGMPKYDNDPTAKVRPEQGLLRLRKTFGLYANIRPVATYEKLYDFSPLREERIKGVDFVVYRELTGGAYFGKKGRLEDGETAFDTIEYSRPEVERIAHLAFKAAMVRRKKVTLVDKANVLETSRLWRETVDNIAKEYPEVTLEKMFVDNAAMQLIQWPAQFDVMLTENMFGDILTDEASVITGSIGLLPSASVGDSVALFEPIHGSYPQAAGKNIANPFGAILSTAMLLDHFGAFDAAQAVRDAIDEALTAGQVGQDIDPENYLSTSELGDVVANRILEKIAY